MFELRVLGSLQLTAPDRRDVEGLAHQAKRAALLAYLAVATPRGTHRRDKILPLFWPELDQTRARAALNQAVYVLRAMLGEHAIIPRGDGALGLTDLVWCDAAAFEEALDAGRPAEAMALYRGDLLDGFFISDAPQFERWLEAERERLKRRAAQGAWALAEAKATEGDVFEAASWAKRAADHVPADEAVIRRLMTFLHGLGDRAAAIRAYETFVSRLAQEYELEPSAETQELVAAIRKERATVSTPRVVQPPAAPPPEPVATTKPRLRLGVVVALVVAATAGLTVGIWNRLRDGESARSPVVRFALEFAPDQRVAQGVGGSTIALSPDGSHLAYLVEGPQGTQLFLRPIDRLKALPIPHTNGARLPFFSPDGQWLGFISGNTIRKVSLHGGAAITICEITTSVPGASWGPNDVIVFATGRAIWRVPASGGEPQIVVRADTARGELYHWPEVLPNGRAAVFTAVDETGFRLAAVSLDNGSVLPLGVSGTSPRFVAPDNLLFAQLDGVILVAPFDQHRLRLTGPALPVAENVYVGISGASKLGVSRVGTMAYAPVPFADRTLVTVSRSGAAERVPVRPAGFVTTRFSPDGRFIATNILPNDGEQPDLWVVDLSTNTLLRLTFDNGSVSPVWSSDGRRIAFSTKPGAQRFGWTVMSIPADGSDSAKTILTAAWGQFPQAFTPGGRGLVLVRRHPATGRDIWTLELEDSNPKPFLAGPADEHSPALSPDGRWLAYVSDETGQNEVYVRAFPSGSGPTQVSLDGGVDPRWGPASREVFYRNEQGLTAATIALSPSLRVLSREVLFDDEPYLFYDVHPDGGRFLMVQHGSQSPHVVVVLNWLSELPAATEVRTRISH